MRSYPEKEPIVPSSQDTDDETPEERRIRRLIQNTAIESFMQGRRSRDERQHDESPDHPGSVYVVSSEPYDEGLSVTTLVFSRVVPIVLIFGLMFGIANGANYVFPELLERLSDFTVRQYTDAAVVNINVILGIAVIASLAISWYLWHGTRLVKLGDELAYLRPRFLPFMAKSKKVVKLSSIDTFNVDQGVFEALFHLNSWKVSLDTPSDEHEIFKNLRGVKDAERLRSIWGNSS